MLYRYDILFINFAKIKEQLMYNKLLQYEQNEQMDLFPQILWNRITGDKYLTATYLFAFGGEARKKTCKSTPKSMLIHVPRASFALWAEKKGICNLVHFKAIWKKKIQVRIG